MAYFSKKEKETIGILSLGTFLEYFDFYLYIHFATVLNQIFFAPSDNYSMSLLTATAYSINYFFRPFAALLFGYLGDNHGRKKVINYTFTLMGISCIGIYFLPTYEMIGVWASILITFFRALQSISSMGEILGGEIYLFEYLKGKQTFCAYAILMLFCSIGCCIALYGIELAILNYFNWRNLFLAGLIIFVLGFFARRNLAETKEFIDAQTFRGISFNGCINKKTILSWFFIEAISPVGFFLSVSGFNFIFREHFNYTEADMVLRNLHATYFCILYTVLTIFLSFKINPLTLAYWRNFCGGCLLILIPFLFNNYMSLEMIIMMQSFWCFFNMGDMHMKPIMIKNTQVLKRFKIMALNFTVARAFVGILIPFGIPLLQPYFGYYIYVILGLPFFIGYHFSVMHFAQLDRNNPNGLLQYYEGRIGKSSN